ncbi:putative exported protein [Aliivibrio wodanis]|uniref:Putative exported protein n=1 Tax=Aliivibrio wodanis TaxID=80852 RepID=A0A090ILB4_9GAMM|nr:putative exported protein [Aliivibrio wodanis]VVV03699.1 hypothetical protein AW0309160_01082 [Aliivibrio wodanis]
MKQIFLIFCLLFPRMSNAEIKLVTLDYPPYITQNNDQLDGVAVRLITHIFQQMSTPMTIEILPWGRAISSVENGSADAIFTAFKTPSREKFADYSKEILFNQTIRIIRSKSSTVNWEKSRIGEYRLCVVNNVSYGSWFDSMLDKKQFKAVYKVDFAEQCVLMISSKRADFWVNNELGARFISANMGVTNKLHLEEPPVESTPSYIAFSKKNQHIKLINNFDQILNSMKKSGTYQKIIDEYFNELEISK